MQTDMAYSQTLSLDVSSQKNKTFIIIIVITIVLCFGCGINIPVKGSGKAVSEKRGISGFHTVDLKGSMDVEVTRSDEFKCIVKGDDNIVPLIITEVKGQRLSISAKQSYSARQKLNIFLEMPELTEVVLSGSGNINMADVTKNTVSLRISGSGDIVAIGEARQVIATVSGTGNLQIERLVAEHVDVTINGSGDASVWAKQSLNARVNGSGNIIYAGDPDDIYNDVNGSGDIVKKQR